MGKESAGLTKILGCELLPEKITFMVSLKAFFLKQLFLKLLTFPLQAMFSKNIAIF